MSRISNFLKGLKSNFFVPGIPVLAKNGCKIQLPNSGDEAKAEVVFNSDGTFLHPLNSTPVVIDGIPITKTVRINDGNTINLGDREYVYTISPTPTRKIAVFYFR